MTDEFHLLVKPMGSLCQLSCQYCYYLSKEELYPAGIQRMSDELPEAYLDQLLAAQPGPEVTVAWQGGEPTLAGLDFYRRAVATAARLRRPHQRVTHTLQTNAVSIDEEWAEFLADHRFLVGVSIEGPRQLHDAYRVDRQGNGTHDRVIRGYRHLVRGGVDVNVLAAVHRANQNRPLEVYRFLRDELGASHLQFIPIVERAAPELPGRISSDWDRGRPPSRPTGDQVTDRSVEPTAFGRFLMSVFDEWVDRDVGTVFIQHFDVALANWLGLPSGLCVFSETCGSALAMEHTGDVYPCDHFVEPELRLGNISDRPLTETVDDPRQRHFGQAKHDRLPARACHAMCDLPATAAAQRTVSSQRMAGTSTTSVTATGRSSVMSMSRCDRWLGSCEGDDRHPTSWPQGLPRPVHMTVHLQPVGDPGTLSAGTSHRRVDSAKRTVHPIPRGDAH